MNLNYQPKFPPHAKYGIGIVGAGDIVKFCHLPAYQTAKFNVVAICDTNIDKARALAKEFGIAHVVKQAKDLIALECVDIVDIATPSQAMPPIVELACKHSKHILCQKPLALSIEGAENIARMLKEANIKGAVNHQMRYSPSINAAKDLLNKNILGQPNYAAFNVNVRQPWETWTFWHDIEYFTLFGHTIHYFDTLRYLLAKTPRFIYTQTAMGMDRNDVPGPLRDYSYLDFGDELKAQIDVNHDNKCGMDDWQAGFRLESAQGVINGSNGALHNYPHGKEDTLQWYEVAKQKWHQAKLQGRWFPDAFMGTMGELMFAIDEHRQPDNSIEDGIDTIRMTVASIESIKQNRPIYLEEL